MAQNIRSGWRFSNSSMDHHGKQINHINTMMKQRWGLDRNELRPTYINPSYLGIIPYYVAAGPVITRTMSPWSTGGSEHARTYDNRRNVYENCTKIYEWVTRKAPPTLEFKPFKNLSRLSPTMYEIWRHVTRAADLGRHLFDFSTTCGEFWTRRMS